MEVTFGMVRRKAGRNGRQDILDFATLQKKSVPET